MSIYDEFATDALELLEEFGTSIAITRTLGESHDPVTGIDYGGITKKERITCVVLSGASNHSSLDYRPALESLDATKQRLVIAAAKDASFMPEDGDKFGPFDNSIWSVIGVNPTSPIGTDVIYKFGIKR